MLLTQNQCIQWPVSRGKAQFRITRFTCCWLHAGRVKSFGKHLMQTGQSARYSTYSMSLTQHCQSSAGMACSTVLTSTVGPLVSPLSPRFASHSQLTSVPSHISLRQMCVVREEGDELSKPLTTRSHSGVSAPYLFWQWQTHSCKLQRGLRWRQLST